MNFGALLANLLQPAGTAAAGAATGAVEGEKEARKLAIENLRQQLLAGQLDLQRMQMNKGHVMHVGNQIVQVTPDGRVSVLPVPQGPLSAVQEAQIGQYKARTKEAEARTEQIKAGKAPAAGKESTLQQYLRTLSEEGPEAAAKFLESVSTVKKAEHVGGSTGAEPKSFEGWQTIAGDPSRPPEERRRAQAIADSIKKGKIEIAGTEAQNRANITEGVQRRKDQAKSDKGIASTYTMLNQLEALIPKLEQKGFLASDGGRISTELARSRRFMQPSDPDLAAWNAHAGTMVAIQRQLGDIGPRAMAAYESAVQIITHPTSGAGARAALGQLRQALDAAHTGQELAKPAPKASPAGGRRRVIGPNGEKGTVPEGTDLSKSPGWRFE